MANKQDKEKRTPTVKENHNILLLVLYNLLPIIPLTNTKQSTRNNTPIISKGVCDVKYTPKIIKIINAKKNKQVKLDG
jgi:hypothetical protein